MSEVRLSKRADRHLGAIYLHGIEQFGQRQAEKYKAEMDKCFAMLARHPKIGRTSPTIKRDLRRHEHGSHVILYREEADGVLVVAVLHARQVRGLKI